ncbi:MAG: FHA domain-containing protein [Myxococcota bacterium]
MVAVDFRSIARSQDLKTFVQCFPDPFLVVNHNKQPQPAREFRTQDITTMDLEPEITDIESAEIFLVKREGSDGTSMITVGRASNMDIVLGSSSVSKLHAYFQRRLDGSGWTIADADSSNGTVLNQRRLESKRVEAIKSGDVLVFAKTFWAEFLEPADAYSRFRSS